MPLESADHRVATSPQQAADTLEVRLEVAAAQELVHGGLSEQRRGDVGAGGGGLDLGRKLVRKDEVADPQARRDRLRERRAVDDVLAVGELEHRGRRAPSKRTSP